MRGHWGLGLLLLESSIFGWSMVCLYSLNLDRVGPRGAVYTVLLGSIRVDFEEASAIGPKLWAEIYISPIH